jgi:hypothetical protein
LADVSAFTGELTVTQLSNWKLWRLEEPLKYEVGSLGSGKVVEAPKGMVTDGASVPRIFWWLLPTWGTYSRAAAIHDYLIGLIEDGTPHKEAMTRRDADFIFWEATGVCETLYLARILLFLGVRITSIYKSFI